MHVCLGPLTLRVCVVMCLTKNRRFVDMIFPSIVTILHRPDMTKAHMFILRHIGYLLQRTGHDAVTLHLAPLVFNSLASDDERLLTLAVKAMPQVSPPPFFLVCVCMCVCMCVLVTARVCIGQLVPKVGMEGLTRDIIPRLATVLRVAPSDTFRQQCIAIFAELSTLLTPQHLETLVVPVFETLFKVRVHTCVRACVHTCARVYTRSCAYSR